LSELVTLAFAWQVLRIAVPYVLAALGGTFAERSGVVNLALEGLLTGGAISAAVGAQHGGVAGGLAAGAAGGVAVATIYGVVVLRLGAEQIVSGVAVNLLMLGLSRFVLKLQWGSASSTPTLAGLDGGVGVTLFVVGTLVAVGVAHVVMARTRYGLRVRAVGEHPDAADSLGVSVPAVRWIAVLASGLGAGLGGAYLMLDNHGYTDRMSGGRGYIALAAMILGRWRPGPVAGACLLFALTDALQLNLQGTVTAAPRELIQVLPYVVTIVALLGAFGRGRVPAALGKPWRGR
jgi:simple sugar transport system permease protein